MGNSRHRDQTWLLATEDDVQLDLEQLPSVLVMCLLELLHGQRAKQEHIRSTNRL
jgi:hypothetical protein